MLGNNVLITVRIHCYRVFKMTSDCIELADDSKYYFWTTSSYDQKIRGFEFDSVFVDCAFMLSNAQKEKIYELLSPCMFRQAQKLFVFVQ